jgi:hypothetical protein
MAAQRDAFKPRNVGAREKGLHVSDHRCRWLSQKDGRSAYLGLRPGPRLIYDPFYGSRAFWSRSSKLVISMCLE